MTRYCTVAHYGDVFVALHLEMKRNLTLYKSLAYKIIYFRAPVVKANYRNMSYAYLRYEEGSDRFQFSFNFEYKHVNRQFNFNRQVTETVNDFLSRISTNVLKAVDKKAKKKPKDVNMSKSELESRDKLDVQLQKDGISLPSELKCGDIIFEVGLKLLVYDRIYEIEVNAPWVNSLVLPDSILAEFPVYPSKLELEFASRNDSHFVWFKSMDDKRNQFSWSKVGEGFFYTPSSNEIGARLRVVCIPRKKSCVEEETYREGPSVEAISPTIIEAGPGACPFEVRHAFTPERVSEGSGTLLTQNAGDRHKHFGLTEFRVNRKSHSADVSLSIVNAALVSSASTKGSFACGNLTKTVCNCFRCY